VHEGGIATPLIVHWPRGIVDPGRMEKTPSHLIDIMATAVDIADADYPKNKTPLEGMSLQPLFQKKFLPTRKLYWEHEGNRAIRDGNWKLVAGFNQPWELYDIPVIDPNSMIFPPNKSTVPKIWLRHGMPMLPEHRSFLGRTFDPRRTQRPRRSDVIVALLRVQSLSVHIFIRGSNASRIPSPRKLSAKSMMAMMPPGKTSVHQNTSI
jgi:hypothetical protein